MLVLKIVVVLCLIALTCLVFMLILDISSKLMQKVILLILFILICSLVIIIETYYNSLCYSRYEFGEMIAGYIFIVGLIIVLVARIITKVKNYIDNNKGN